MADGTGRLNNGDYSCEVLSLIVLFLLSALSHFWYILIAVGFGIFLWISLALLGKFLISAAQAFPRHERCLWPVMTSRSETNRDSPETRRRVRTPLVNEIPVPSLFLAGSECNGTASISKESDPQSQVF